jgi:poly(A) polymerase
MINIPPHIFPNTPGAYLVGGSIRDFLLGNQPIDYDVVVSNSAEKYAHQVASNLNGRVVQIGKPGQTVVRVVSKGTIVDISPLNGKNIVEDLHNRDFTINAMAYDLANNTLLDHVDGQSDLVKKTIRMLSPRAFVKDPLRLLRAYRLATCLNFNIEPLTASVIEQNADLIQRSAGERIRDELFKMMAAKSSRASVSQMAENGLIMRIFPELEMRFKANADTSGCRLSMERILDAYGRLEILLKNPFQILPHTLESLFDRLDKGTAALLKFSMLWHDIGVPPDHPDRLSGESTAQQYAIDSAETAKHICKRLKFSNRHTDYIILTIQNQSRPFALNAAFQRQQLPRKSMVRFFIDCRNQTPEVMLHALARCHGEGSKKNPEARAFVNFAVHLLGREYPRYLAKTATGPLIKGHDLIHELGMKPSPVFKRVLDFVEEERLSRSEMNRAEALDLARNRIAALKSSSKSKSKDE